MKLCFLGFDSPITLSKSHVSVVQIANEHLFSRVCQSLLACQGESSVEPYSVWDDQGEAINPANAFIAIENPFCLPVKHKSLLGQLFSMMNSTLQIDEDTRTNVQRINHELNSTISQICLNLNADYSFALEWDLSRYLRSFDFGLEQSESASLFEKIISFIDLAADMHIKEALLFINIKTFLTKNELKTLNKRLIFHGIEALMLENQRSIYYDEYETKCIIDQHFIEYEVRYQPESTPSSQGRICANGFGAVTF